MDNKESSEAISKKLLDNIESAGHDVNDLIAHGYNGDNVSVITENVVLYLQNLEKVSTPER